MHFSKIHLGSVLRQGMQSRNKDIAWLANAFGLQRRSTLLKLDEEYIQPEQLRRVSLAFGEDLFIHLLSDETKALLREARNPAPVPPPAPKEIPHDPTFVQVSIEELNNPESVPYLKQEVARLRREIAYLTQINELICEKNDRLTQAQAKPPGSEGI